MSTLFRIPSWRAAAGWLTATALLALLVVPPLAAQQGSERLAEMSEVIISAAGAEDVGDFNVSAARRRAGFQLFGSADAAGIGAHLSGNFGFATDNLSLCDAPLSGFCAWNVNPARGNFFTFQFFEVLLFAGAPPSEWIKLRNLAPSVANAKGGGYVTHVNFALFAGRLEWGPRDGTLGSLFTGVTSTNDGSCRDNTGASNGFFPTGLPLLPASNCPETWGNGVWQGDRTTPVEGWLQLLQQQGQNFAFDFWRVPDDLKRPGLFMGTGFSSFGETSDHYSEILQSYGSVIPGGTGDPAFEGWPLGLIWRFEMFDFGVPSLASVKFWRATVINRSEDVYGVGLDYDSLYLGFAPGTGGSGGGGGPALLQLLPARDLGGHLPPEPRDRRGSLYGGCARADRRDAVYGGARRLQQRRERHHRAEEPDRRPPEQAVLESGIAILQSGTSAGG
ncbi:MAG: hypothetical protein IH965_06670 [Gemmatimonadetes bacterium]|nr:hypothetical protein [Gemmatimonadota bacterium]